MFLASTLLLPSMCPANQTELEPTSYLLFGILLYKVSTPPSTSLTPSYSSFSSTHLSCLSFQLQGGLDLLVAGQGNSFLFAGKTVGSFLSITYSFFSIPIHFHSFRGTVWMQACCRPEVLKSQHLVLSQLLFQSQMLFLSFYSFSVQFCPLDF